MYNTKVVALFFFNIDYYAAHTRVIQGDDGI